MPTADDKACAICVKRHPVSEAVLQCRALPAVSDGVSPMARFPVVRADDYCHDAFALDADAAKARDAARAETARLDAKVAETQARSAAKAAQPELALEHGAPMKDAPKGKLPPAGDAPPVHGRARRARGVAAK